MFSVFQSSIGVILSTPDSYPGVPPGLPVGNGVFVSIIITFILLGISNFFGLIIDKTVWIRSFSSVFIGSLSAQYCFSSSARNSSGSAKEWPLNL